MAITIALAGNPNSGKTTLFNMLTGSNQFVGNWPGVTVEKKAGAMKGREDVTLIDLPGVYSLSPYTMEEVVTRNYLMDEKPDAILNVIDGTNLERNLYLTTQFTEMAIPVVIAINMMDVVNKKGDKIDVARLSKELGCPVVEISALKGTGVEEAAEVAIRAAGGERTIPRHSFSGGVEHTLAHIEEYALHNLPQEQQRYFAIKLFERDDDIIKRLGLKDEQVAHIEGDIGRREKEWEDDSKSIIIAERYSYIDSIIQECITVKNKGGLSTSDKVDRIVTNRYLALPLFAIIIFAVYFISVSSVGAVVTDWANDGVFGNGWRLFGAWVPGIPVLIGDFLDAVNCADWLRSLILDGIVAGVGSVLGFVPQLLILFLLLAFLEACGYMSRIAFIMDRIFRRFGLSGKSFIPLLIGTGCSVPGILASRTIESERDRRMTIMTTSFIPCSAKLPMIALIAGSMFGGAWWVAPSAYLIGIAAVVCSGVILKKTRWFDGDVAPFVMELPPYHWPTLTNLLRSMWERGWSFVKKAGTIILLASMAVWFASNYGWSGGGFGQVEMDESMLSHIGKVIAPLFAPLGWGKWQPAVATMTGLIAKENVVGTLGVFFGFTEAAEANEAAWSILAANFTALTAFSFLLFNLLCAPCFAAMSAIKREMYHAKWFWAAVGYQCALAYVTAFCVYQFGAWFSGGGFGVGTVVALAACVSFLYLLYRPAKRRQPSNPSSGKRD